MIHTLKTWPEFFKEIKDGQKTFELCKDDRPFSIGDILVLQEWCPKANKYTGASHQVFVKHILRTSKFGLKNGYCILSIEDKVT